MALIILTAVALSAPVAESSASQQEPVVSSEGRVSRGALPPDPRRNVRESAYVLGHGELLVGTDGVAVGVLPSVQLSTQALLDVVGWFNGGVKVEAVRGRHLSLSVQGAGAAATWGEMQGRHLDVGSTASTATRWPRAIRFWPSASMKVLLPTPGTPVMPTRIDLPAWGSSRSSNARAIAWSSTRWLSTTVIARPSAVRSPASTPATSSSTLGRWRI